ncbi:MAG: CDP-glycerol glycerophosphotransferase family protein [Bacteroidia bacterium]|nr:CDP-glycerol glycerophosphotransferase family protein [Bacteroidia bacterium]
MKALAYLVCYLIYPFSFLFPRKKNRFAFGSFRGAFNDNAKYLFIYANENVPGLDAAWISKDGDTVKKVRELGFKAYRSTSLKGALFALTSKYWFFNSYTSDIMFCLSGGATCVNLWHGVGLKRIEFNTVSGPLADRFIKKKFKEVFFHPESFRRPDRLLTSAPFQTSMFAEAFRIPEEKCLELGYPRNVILNKPKEDVMAFARKYEPESTLSLIEETANYRKTYIYMPTWRDSQREIFVQGMDLTELNDALQANGDLVLLKPHANTIVTDDIKGFSNIRLIDSKADVYPVLPFTDTLITDYSSILYDYLLMEGKNVILYLYDYEQYVKERDFFYPFDENVIGERAYCFEELLDCIRNGVTPMDEKHRENIIAKFWGDSARVDASKEITDRFITCL